MTILEGFFTVSAIEAGRTRAGVGALAGVEAGATVEARFVIGAIVEILVTE